MKFVHAADLHLDSPLRSLDRYEGVPVERFQEATRVALQNLVALCIDERVDLLVIAGDLYDGDWRDYRTGLYFGRQMQRLREADIPVVMVRGNHDARSEITRHLRLPDNVSDLSVDAPESRLLDKLGVAVHGQGYASRAVVEDLSQRYPAPVPGILNIGLLHTALDGRPGHGRYAPAQTASLAARGYDYWALGHVHTREVVSEAPWIVFPGNLQGRHPREAGPKGATLVRQERPGGPLTVEHRALDAVRWEHVSVNAEGAATAEEAIERARPAIDRAAREAGRRPLALRLAVHGKTHAHARLGAEPERWLNELRMLAAEVVPAGAWIERVELGTRGALDLDALAGGDDAIGQLLGGLRAMAADPAQLAHLASAFAELKARLPPELRGNGGVEGGEETPALDDPQLIRALLGDVEELLVSRLLDPGDAP